MAWYQAPAKINLGLWVGPRDASGFHVVDTVMQTVGMADQLYLEPRDHMLWESTSPLVPMNDQNLVVRAYWWAKRRLPNLPPVFGRLEKVTWVGAGLGGGSSDAAAMIRWAFEGLPGFKQPAFLQDTAELGMDVPFFVLAGTARVRGHGEFITPLPSLKVGAVVLANPGIPLETAAVYRAFDARNTLEKPGRIDAVVKALECGDTPSAQDLRNDLEWSAFQVMPRLREFRERIQASADGALFALSGSGPTYYILGSDEDWADWMARRLRALGVPWVEATAVSESW